MSLIIPDLSMPNSCIECPCYYDGYCTAFEDSKNVDYNIGDIKRMDYCPLILMETKVLEQESVLDKIRVEIKNNMESIIGKYDSSVSPHEMPSYKIQRNEAREECIKIIDKYRAESEE